jgi:hypothetical protein
MPVNSFKVGPGVFTLGAGPTAFETQVRSCTVQVSENVKTTEAVPMLSGDELPEEETASYKYAVAVSFQQDLGVGGVVAYTWTNEGQEVPFSYVPNTVEGAEIEGVCRIVPVNVGGDADTRPSSDVTFACIGKPTFTP